MPKESILQFNNYTVEELMFQKVDVTEEQSEFQLYPCFDSELLDRGNNNYDVKLSIEILPDEEHPMPFQLRVSIVGHFTYLDNSKHGDEKLKDHVLQKNTVSILFPFLRQIVASLTNMANIATLMLPIMNFHSDSTECTNE